MRRGDSVPAFAVTGALRDLSQVVKLENPVSI